MKTTRKIFTLILILAVMLCGSISFAQAATSLPDSVVTDPEREVEYIKNFPVIVK